MAFTTETHSMEIDLPGQNYTFEQVKKKYNQKLDYFYSVYVNYICHLRNIKTPVPINMFLKDIEIQKRVYEILKNPKLIGKKWENSTTRCYLNALKQFIVIYPISDLNFIKLIDQDIKTLGDLIAVSENENRLDGKEIDRWMDWDTIIRVYANLVKLCDKIDDNTEYTISSYILLQQRLMLAMYVFHYPLRLDYGCIRILPENPDLCTNYIYENPGDNLFHVHIGRDKVAHKMGPHDFILCDEIIGIMLHLMAWVFTKISKTRLYLITDVTDVTQPLCVDGSRIKNRLSRMLYTIPGITPGKYAGLTVDTIRSAWVTHFCRQMPSMAEKMKAAAGMRSSTAIMDRSYYKVEQDEKESNDDK